jgi:fructose-bisphosphate aldolase class II
MTNLPYALHLDHGHSFQFCKEAIDLGFSSVMIDGSALPFAENVALTKKVVSYARKRGVSVEVELGALAGFEDENTNNSQLTTHNYTDPVQAAEFVRATGCDSLAIAIGTSHGAYKRQNSCEQLSFDILKKIAKLLPDFPLVLHGASMIPQNLIDEINAHGGKIKGAGGIPPEQIRKAIKLGICKVNIDSDARLAWTAALRSGLSAHRDDFDPRKFLSFAREKMTELYIDEIKKVMGSGSKL